MFAVCVASPEFLHLCFLSAPPGWRTCRVLRSHCTPFLLLYIYNLEQTHKRYVSNLLADSFLDRKFKIVGADISSAVLCSPL